MADDIKQMHNEATEKNQTDLARVLELSGINKNSQKVAEEFDLEEGCGCGCPPGECNCGPECKCGCQENLEENVMSNPLIIHHLATQTIHDVEDGRSKEDAILDTVSRYELNPEQEETLRDKVKQQMQTTEDENIEELDEGKPVTREDPLVVIWEGPDSPDYPEQGLMGHYNLSTYASIYDADTTGVAEKLEELGEGKRLKVGRYYLEYSEHNKREMAETMDEGWLDDEFVKLAGEYDADAEPVEVDFGEEMDEEDHVEAEYDYGYRKHRPARYGAQVYDYKGRAETTGKRLRITNNYGDNPMIRETDPQTVSPEEAPYGQNGAWDRMKELLDSGERVWSGLPGAMGEIVGLSDEFEPKFRGLKIKHSPNSRRTSFLPWGTDESTDKEYLIHQREDDAWVLSYTQGAMEPKLFGEELETGFEDEFEPENVVFDPQSGDHEPHLFGVEEVEDELEEMNRLLELTGLEEVKKGWRPNPKEIEYIEKVSSGRSLSGEEPYTKLKTGPQPSQKSLEKRFKKSKTPQEEEKEARKKELALKRARVEELVDNGMSTKDAIEAVRKEFEKPTEESTDLNEFSPFGHMTGKRYGQKPTGRFAHITDVDRLQRMADTLSQEGAPESAKRAIHDRIRELTGESMEESLMREFREEFGEAFAGAGRVAGFGKRKTIPQATMQEIIADVAERLRWVGGAEKGLKKVLPDVAKEYGVELATLYPKIAQLFGRG